MAGMLIAGAIPEKISPLFPEDAWHARAHSPTPGITFGPHSYITNFRSREPPSTEKLITRNTAHEDTIYKISV